MTTGKTIALTIWPSQSWISKKISPEYSVEGLMMKLKLQYFGHLMWRTDSLENILMLERLNAGGEWDDRGWHGWMASLTQWIWIWASSGSWWWTSKPDMFQSMGSQRVEHDYMTELNRSSHCVFHGIKSRSLFYNGDKSHSWGLSLHGPASKCCHIGY